MKRKKTKRRDVESQAVIVITSFNDGTMLVRTDNDTTSIAAQIADAASKMVAEVLKEAVAKDAALANTPEVKP